jgi:hypothetical protein
MQNQLKFCTSWVTPQSYATNRSLRTIEGYDINCALLTPSCDDRGDPYTTMIGTRCYQSEDISGGTPKPKSSSRSPLCPNRDVCKPDGTSCVSK